MSLIKFRHEINGLRAIAVIPVILFHMFPVLLPGGYLGVDIFFVISGYLITSIILKEYYHGVFSFSTFWMKRVKRIFPALFVMVLITSIIGYFVLYAPSIKDLGMQGLGSMLSYVNIYFWMFSGSYWGASATSSPLLHTWSLSVEEQFYLFFPIALIILLKNFEKSMVLILTLSATLLISFGAFVYGDFYFPNATFYLLPTRAWELGVGCLIAVLIYHKIIKVNDNVYLSLLGLFLIIFSYALVNEAVSSIYLIFPVLGAALIILFSATKRNVVFNILSLPIISFIGIISYSLYIWHWPILLLMKEAFSSIDETIIVMCSVPIIFLVSIMSYKLIENRIRYSQKPWGYILPIMFIAIGYSTFLANSNFSESMEGFNVTKSDGGLYNIAPKADLSRNSDRLKGIVFSKSKDIPYKAYASGGIIEINGSKKPEIVVLGDSHALMWSNVISGIAKDLGHTVSFYAANGTPTFFDIPIVKGEPSMFFSATEKKIYDEKRLYYLKKWKPKVVIISSKWADQERTLMKPLIEYIGHIGSKILLIQDPPVLYFGDKNAPQYISYLGLKPKLNKKQYLPNIKNDSFIRGDYLINDIAKEFDFCTVLPVTDIFTDGNKIWVLDGGDVLYIDDDHLSKAGVLKIRARFEEKIKAFF